jgi:hypothetical protein
MKVEKGDKGQAGENESKHHSYSLVERVGKGNFGEALLVESTLDRRRYIMKVVVGVCSESAWRIAAGRRRNRS